MRKLLSIIMFAISAVLSLGVAANPVFVAPLGKSPAQIKLETDKAQEQSGPQKLQRQVERLLAEENPSFPSLNLGAELKPLPFDAVVDEIEDAPVPPLN